MLLRYIKRFIGKKNKVPLKGFKNEIKYSKY